MFRKLSALVWLVGIASPPQPVVAATHHPVPRTYAIQMQDVEAIQSGIRQQLRKLILLQNVEADSNALFRWIAASTVTIDFDPASSKLLVRIVSPLPMPMISLSDIPDAEPVQLDGLEGLQFFADQELGPVIREAKTQASRPGVYEERMVLFTQSLVDRLAHHGGMTYAPAPEHAGLGLLFKRAAEQAEEDSWRNPPQCGPIGTGKAWALNGVSCFVIDDQTSVVPCQYNLSTTTDMIITEPDGNIHRALSEVTAKAMTWADVQCGLSSFDIAFRYVIAFPQFPEREPGPPADAAAAAGEPGWEPLYGDVPR